ncbi:signal peptidase II [Halodesulfovibrio spirochaetisodalis]|uniref:Lipoprotein signal peptidase n=1 Tax=Halodesulfovibrio spirochaetisodalis TaxID=1560234 RepID=A0A1B7XJL2_9BACT|nr:signal peptidase II [Halodesulfovibrio spirochaetisodalis]OBQ55684.1 peptidase A8 [Halodesulfovibrio spirochaetisodalis]
MRNRYLIVYGIGLFSVIADQFTKWLTVQNIPLWSGFPVIPGFFNLVHVLNRGAAFGFLNNTETNWQIWLFSGAAVAACIAVHLMTRSAKPNKLLFTALGLILGGAVGNLIDRIRIGAVIDFLDFYYKNYHWPAFNVADICICVGAGLILLTVKDIA